MVFILLIAVLVHSQDAHLGNKPEKFNACLFLTRLKLQLDKEQFAPFLQEGISEEKLGNRVSSDMLHKCYRSIDLDTAIEVITIGEKDLEMNDKFETFVQVDYESYREGGFEITPELQEFFDEIKIMKEDAEVASLKAPPAAPPLPPVGIWYILLVIGLFGGFFYWLSNKVLAKPEKLKGKDRKKKKNN